MTEAPAYDKALAETMEDNRNPAWEPMEEKFGRMAGYEQS